MSYQPHETHDGVDTLFNAAYNQTYHSVYGALTETEHVFLRGTGIEARLAAGEPCRILEIGFGTGLNFFATARANPSAPLVYVSLEQDLLPAELLRQLNHAEQLPEIAPLYEAFLAWRETLPDVVPPSTVTWQHDAITLTLVIGEATTAPIPSLGYHAIYHDAFAPDANPELWTAAFFARLLPFLEAEGKLATYSVKGTVRRALQAIGFTVEKQPGPPGKREMLVATA